MIKKSKDCFKLIAAEIQKTLDSKENICLEISKGLWGLGSIAIRNKVCEEMNINKPWNAPFTIKICINGEDSYGLNIKYK